MRNPRSNARARPTQTAVVLSAAILLVIGSAGLVIYYEGRAALLTGIEHHLAGEFLYTKTNVERSVSMLIDRLESCAAQPVMARILDDDEDHEIAELLTVVGQQVHGVIELTCLSSSGKVIAATNPGRFLTGPVRVGERGSSGQRYAFSAVADGERITVPVVVQFDEPEQIGTLEAVIDPASFLVGLPSWWLGLTTASGDVVAQRGPRFPNHLPPDVSHYSDPEVGDVALSSRPARMPPGGTAPPWRIVVGTPSAELYRPLGIMGRMVGGIMGVSALLVVLVVLYFNRKQRGLLTRLGAQYKSLEATARELVCQKAAMDEHAAVTATDVAGNITYVNDKFCRFSGYTREELLGENHRMIKSDEHPPEFFRELWETITRGNVWRGEIKNRHKDGSFYWVAATIVPFVDERGTTKQYMAIRTNITNLRNLEAQARSDGKNLMDQKEKAEALNQKLQHLNARLEEARAEAVLAAEAKSRFLANMSHEIRTPMTAILGFADNLLDHNLSDEERSDAIRTIRTSGEHLLNVINDILDISKIEAGKIDLEQIRCRPHEIVADVASLMENHAAAKMLVYQTEFAGPIPETIRSDPTRLRQILINVVGNAIKFTPAGSVRLIARFDADETNPHLQFDIVDTGMGMTGEQVEALFEPFTQADSSMTRKFGGTGLGLTISKRLARLLGGDLVLVDTQPGRGTRFRVTVRTGALDGVRMIDKPVVTTPAKPTRATAESTPDAALHGHILLAEDGPDNQRLISFVLKKAGAKVSVVENGQLAVDAALAAREEKQPFDVILMDMQMPVLDGYQATTTLRERGYAGPIIALTAHAMSGDREKCLTCGCDDYATKPIDRAKLIALVGSYLRTATVEV